MKKILPSLIALLLLTCSVIPAQAVENGIDATGSQFVVPIKIEVSPNVWATCSGALISSYTVVTAGHCVVGSDGLVTSKIYVGMAGSSMQSISINDIIDSVKITSSYQSGANNTIGDDDLAFIKLKKPQVLPLPVLLASESQVTAIKIASGQLRLTGYGRYGDTSEEVVTFPKSFSGNFSQIPTKFTNSAYLESTIGNACSGDSGGPILSITATQVTLIGITTGVIPSKYCTKILDGKYYTLFTLIGRYANLAFSSANDTMNTLNQQYNTLVGEIASVKSQLASAKASLTDVSDQLTVAQGLIDAANSSKIELQTQLDTMKKANLALTAKLKKICSVKPKPKGC